MKKVLEFIKSFCAIILIILSFAFINVYMALQSTSRLVSKENITSIIKETDFTDLIDQIDREELYSELEESGVSNETVDSILDNEQFKETIADLISVSLTSLIEGTEIASADKDDFSEKLNEVFDTVIKENDIKLTAKEIEDAHKEIENGVGEIVDSVNKSGIIDSINDGVDSDETIASLKDGVEVVRIVYKNRGWFLVVSIIFLVLAALLKLKNFKFLKWIGGTMIFYGVTFLSFGKTVLTAWGEFVVKQAEQYKNILEASVGTMAKTYYIAGFIFLILGILMIAAKPVYEKIKSKKQETVTE